MSRLSRLALSKRSVTILFAGALFLAGISAWGSLKQELLPDIEFPVITVVAPYPGGRLTSAEAIAGLVVGYERSAATTPGGPAASSAPGASATTPAPSTAPAVRTPITLGGLGTVQVVVQMDPAAVTSVDGLKARFSGRSVAAAGQPARGVSV